MPGDPQQEAAYRAADLKLFESGQFADVIVKCEAKEWHVHMNILCTRSKWFEKALTSPYVTVISEGPLEPGMWREVTIHEQDPDAIDVCLRYIYGGVAAIDMAKVTEFQSPFSFCADLYRSADFLLLEPLLPVIKRHLGQYCDEKTRWLWTRGNIEKDMEEKTVVVWIEDLKNAILEVMRWNTPVIEHLLMEFVWASRWHLNCVAVPTNREHINIGLWLRENVPYFTGRMTRHCKRIDEDALRAMRGSRAPDQVWTPEDSLLAPMPSWSSACPRCNSYLDVPVFPRGENAWGQLKDPFNLNGSTPTRAWCRRCAGQVRYPWRENGYY